MGGCLLLSELEEEGGQLIFDLSIPLRSPSYQFLYVVYLIVGHIQLLQLLERSQSIQVEFLEQVAT